MIPILSFLILAGLVAIYAWFPSIRALVRRGYHFAAARANTFVRGLIHFEPLPRWTNAPLFLLGCGVWFFAISISWWGDNLTYVISSLLILGGSGAAIFAYADKPSDYPSL